MDILFLKIKYQCSAVSQLSTQGQALLPGQSQQCFLTNLSQIAGDDQVEVAVTGMQVIEVSLDSSKGRWG